MQNYINIKEEKQRAIFNILRKYAPIVFTIIVGALLNALDIFEIFGLKDLLGIDGFGGSLNQLFSIGIVLFFIAIPSILGILSFFYQDISLLIPLLRNQFQLRTDFVTAIRPNNAKLSAEDKENGLVLKRYKIYFRDTLKTYNDSHYTNLQPGDYVYLWVSTDPRKYEKILFVTKIN